MIIGPDFVWLHFPKCAGTAVQTALRKIYARRKDVQFDDITKPEVIWHHSVEQRLKYDPSSDLLNKKIICCIRRLPNWLLSRIHFEASRSPHHIATREMIESGIVLEETGETNSADLYARMYSEPRVDKWVRVEFLADDLAEALNLDAKSIKAAMKKDNQNEFNFIKNPEFWFTRQQLDRLYEANPNWADIEQKVYGDLL